MRDTEWQDLIHTLRAAGPAESAAAATRLHKTATAEDVARLMDLLNDDNFCVREAAAWPLSELAGTSVLRELLVAYQRGFDDGHDNDGFTTALIELVEADSSASKAVLKRLAEDPDSAVRENATWLLDFCS